MGNTPQPFRQHHVRRLLKAASDGGLRNPSVHVRLPGGTDFHVAVDAGKPVAAAVLKPVAPTVVRPKVRPAAPVRRPVR
jgi:hypothetical protein